VEVIPFGALEGDWAQPPSRLDSVPYDLCTVWAKRLVLSDSAGTWEVRGCAGGLRGAADSWHDKAAPTGVKCLNGLV
jgi:hypothetical protein